MKNPAQPSRPSNRDALLAELAQRERQLEIARERQAATSRILEVISASPGDVAPVFDAIANSANRLLGGLSTAVWRFEGEVGHLAAFTATNPEADAALRALSPLPVRELSVFVVLRKGEIAQLPDTEAGPARLRDLARLRGYRAMLFVPLLQSGEAVGFVSVTRKEPGAFNSQDVQLLKIFADQAVIAIQNARLFTETNQALERQKASADVLGAIGRSVSDATPVFEEILDAGERLFNSAEMGIYTVGADEMVRVAAWRGPRRKEVQNDVSPLGDSVTGRIIQERRTHHVPNLIADPNLSPTVRERAERLGSASLLYAPMLWEDRGLGSILVVRSPPKPFTERETELLQTFADQAAIAIENARMFGELQARTRDLSESLLQQTATSDVLKVISRSAFDLQTVFNTLVSSAVELSGALTGTICVRDGDVFRYRDTVGAQHTSALGQYLRAHPAVPGRATIAGRVLLSGRVERIPDCLADPEYIVPMGELASNVRSLLGVPLLRKDGIEGAIILTRAEPGEFTARQIEIVQTFADQAVIALENVRLFDEVQARTSELAASLDDLRKAQDRLVQSEKLASLGQLTAGIAHEIKNPLNFVNNFSALSRELLEELRELLARANLADGERAEADELFGMLDSNLDKIVNHGKRADSIIKNMLLHSREGSGVRSSVNVNAMVEEALNLAYHGARAEKPGFNSAIVKSLDPLAGVAELHAQEITRVLLNLISNGFYATTKRKQADPAHEPVITASTRDLGDFVEIAIRDNGVGISPQVRSKMFNPFFTTKPAGEGTGLGLSLSHDIVVKQHGGSIEVETEPGAFTQFTLRLPRKGLS